MEKKRIVEVQARQITPGHPSIGIDQVHLFPVKPKLDLGFRLYLYIKPTILTVVTIFLLLCFIATGSMLWPYITRNTSKVTMEITHIPLYNLWYQSKRVKKTGIYGIVGNENALYVEIASSGIGFILSVMEAVLLVVIVKTLIKLKIAEDAIAKDAVYMDDATDYEIHLSANLQAISLKTGLILFVGTILLNSTLICVFWGCAIINMEFSPPEVYPYYVVDVLLGAVAPISFVVSIYILVAVGKNVTYGELTPQSMIPAFLSFVKYNKEEQYWIIVKYFTFPVRTRGIAFWKNVGKHRCVLPLFNLSTWCLNIMMVVTFCLAITYIVGDLVSDEEVINSCSELQDTEMNCFEHVSHQYVNCSNESLVGRYNCFRFNEIGVHNDPITTFIRALFLYIACDKFLTVLFNFASQLFRIRASKIWGVFISAIGFILVSISATSIILYRVLHTTSFNFLSLLQFFIISVDILLAGILLSIVSTRRAKKTSSEAKVPQKENDKKTISEDKIPLNANEYKTDSTITSEV